MFPQSLLVVYCLSLLACFAPASATFARRSAFLNVSTTTSRDVLPPTPITWNLPSLTRTAQQFPHIESTVSGFHDTTKKLSASISRLPDMISIIQSVIGTIPATAHLESSATDFGTLKPPSRTSELGRPTAMTPTGPIDWERPRWQSSATGFEGRERISEFPSQITAPPNRPPPVTVSDKVLDPKPITSIRVSDKVLTPGGETVTFGNGPTASKIFVDTEGRPIIVVGTSTSAWIPPITVGDKVATGIPDGIIVEDKTAIKGGPPITVIGKSGKPTTISVNEAGETIAVVDSATSTVNAPATQALTIGEITATAVADDYQFIIGSTTLKNGQAITVDGTVMSMTTDAAGQTILVAGSLTTTLPASPSSHEVHVSRTVIDGTTLYVIGDQTLGPENPITINDTPMSISTVSGTTILVIGDMTTTISSPSRTGLQDFDGAATPGVNNPAPGPATTSAGSDGSKNTQSWQCLGVGFVALGFAFKGFG